MLLDQWINAKIQDGHSKITAKSFFSLLPRAGDVHLGGHILPEWRPSKVISLPFIWSCMKPENWLRINLSADWCLCIALRTHSGACHYWIGLSSIHQISRLSQVAWSMLMDPVALPIRCKYVIITDMSIRRHTYDSYNVERIMRQVNMYCIFSTKRCTFSVDKLLHKGHSRSTATALLNRSYMTSY